MAAQTPRYGLLASRFNREITTLLVQGALRSLRTHRVPRSRIDVVWVPGAFELSVAALRMAKSHRYQAIIAVGCILQGETPHWRHLSQATLQGLTIASVLTGVPITCGVITARGWKQAVARAQKNGLNRGKQAAEAAWGLVKALNAHAR